MQNRCDQSASLQMKCYPYLPDKILKLTFPKHLRVLSTRENSYIQKTSGGRKMTINTEVRAGIGNVISTFFIFLIDISKLIDSGRLYLLTLHSIQYTGISREYNLPM